MVAPRFILLLISLDCIFRFQVVLGVDELKIEISGNSRIQRFDLSPTASLLEERRQRELQNDGRRRRRRLEIPDHWFHPYVNAIYATLQPSRNNSTNDNDSVSTDYDIVDEFHSMRHWSRYERAYQNHYQNLRNFESPLLRHDDIDWHDFYSNYSSVSLLDDISYANNRSVRGESRRLSSSLQRSSSLYGGQFNHYQAVPLSQGYGTHYVNLWVGSPTPQRQTVIADTGSHFTAFPCVGCHKCGAEHHTDPHFDPEQSETFHALQCSECVATSTTCDASLPAGEQQCHFTQSYTEGSSWKAYQARDLVYGGGQDVLHAANPLDHQMAIPFLFGCLTSETGLFVTQLATGIMGMSAHELTLVKQLYNAGKLEHNLFAMCFRRELGTSKRGVTAGSMTMGGVSSSLDTSPMVYAKNIQPYGWFTVFVKGIYIAKDGGKSFAFNNNDDVDDFSGNFENMNSRIVKQRKNIIKVPVDIAQINSGKGVIVDSGTTDTYLSKSLAKKFGRVWKKVTGMDYTHAPIYLTQSQLHRLPTILVQCQAAQSGDGTPPSAPYFVGQVGDLDPDSPQDLLLAIPATHYMEYSPALKLYTSRLYFTESRGGVLGANAMMGHNVVFDWENGRIGFAQSSCAYDEEDEEMASSSQRKSSNSTSSLQQREGYARDCRLSLIPPALTTQCIDTVDVRLCLETDQPTNVALMGTQIWTWLIETPGTHDGKSCPEAARELRRQELILSSSSITSTASMSNLPSEFVCTGEGLCLEYRPCEVSCKEVLEHHEVSKKNQQPDGSQHPSAASGSNNEGNPTPSTPRQNDKPNSMVTPLGSVPCGDSYWSACDVMCKQSRILTKPDPSNGVCIELSRQSRTCHIDACGRNDPCRVPFLVHATFALKGGSAKEWNAQSLDIWQRALFQTAHRPKFFQEGHQRILFQPGDVDVLSVRPWWKSEDEIVVSLDDKLSIQDLEGFDDSILGLEVVIQISIFNNRAHDIERSHKPPPNGESADESNTITGNQDDPTAHRPPQLRRLQAVEIKYANETLSLSHLIRPTIASSHNDNSTIEATKTVEVRKEAAEGTGTTRQQRHLLQEIGDMVRNMTIFQRKRAIPETTCQEADLYPLAKDAVLLATSIFQHPDFVANLVGAIEQLEIKEGVTISSEETGSKVKNHADMDSHYPTSPFAAVYQHLGNQQSSRVLSSWPVGTQVYDSKINYFGPIAATPYIFFLRVCYEASVIFLLISLASMILQNVSRYYAGFKVASITRIFTIIGTFVIVRALRLCSYCRLASCWSCGSYFRSKFMIRASHLFPRSKVRHSYEAVNRLDDDHCEEAHTRDDNCFGGTGSLDTNDDDESSLTGTIMGSLLRPASFLGGRNSKKDDTIGIEEIELAYANSVSDVHAERRNSTTKRRNSMPLQHSMTQLTIPTSLSG